MNDHEKMPPVNAGAESVGFQPRMAPVEYAAAYERAGGTFTIDSAPPINGKGMPMFRRSREAVEAVKDIPGIAKGVIFIAIMAFIVAIGAFVMALGTRGMVANA